MNTKKRNSAISDPPLTQIIVGSIDRTIESFIQDRRAQGLSRKTIRIYNQELGYFLKYLKNFHIKVMDDISAPVIRSYLESLATHRNKGGVHISYRSIRSFCYWYEQETDGEYHSPTRKVKVPVPPGDPLNGIPIEDVERMVDCCETENAKRDKALLLVMADTGVRVDEIITCNISDLDPSLNSLHVYGKGHNGVKKERNVFLGKRSRAALRAYLKTRSLSRTDPVFVTETGERMDYYTVRQIIRRRAKDAHLNYVPSPHDFRREFALECWRNGMDVITLARLMGHSEQYMATVLRRYLAQNTGDLMRSHQMASPVDNAWN